MIEKFYMIVNVAGADESGVFDGVVRKEYAPRYMHWKKDEADRELLRLQSHYPCGEFVLLEAIGKAEQRSMAKVSAYIMEPVL